MSIAPVRTRQRLLAAWEVHGRSDLAAHLAVHGHQPPVDATTARRLMERLTRSGLLGRGGGGFPTARKVDGHRHLGGRGSLVVNAMEGEPASAKDATLVMRAPHLLLDGAQLAAAVAGSARIVICIGADRDDLDGSLAAAMVERRGAGLTPVPVEIARPPGRYIAGEESALVNWLDHRRGVPTVRFDKSVPLRLGGWRVLVHNAETIAQIGVLGRDTGDDTDPVLPVLTALVTLSGAVQRPGVYEVELGTSLADIVRGAGRIEPVQAVLVGGYAGTWLGAEQLAVPFSPAGLRPVGASPGAGVLVAVSRSTCGVAETAGIAAYMASQSAGQCGPCVYGLPAIAADLGALADGRADSELLQRLSGRLGAVVGRGACGHPDGVARMVNSALDVFADDVSCHALSRTCAHATPRATSHAAHRGSARLAS